MVWIVFKDLNGSSRFKGFQHTRITIHTIPIPLVFPTVSLTE